MIGQCLVGLGVLLTLPAFAQLVALAAIPLVAAYPLMKRITWWPQVWLGLTFNWGVLVAGATMTGALDLPFWLLYAGLALWTVGYDTIYALQDKEDDALIGVRSSARRLGDSVQIGVAIIYALTIAIVGSTAAVTTNGPALLGLAAISPFASHLLGQLRRVSPDLGDRALGLFKSNQAAAFLLLGGLSALAIYTRWG